MTSQIFANIYLNEFDRFVRHEIKPLGYVRYGDDFIVIMNDRISAVTVQRIATTWLKDNLKLTVHTKNNIVVKASQGLRFLGHTVHPLAPLAVDRRMVAKVLTELDTSNIASYQAMHLPRRKVKLLPWLVRVQVAGLKRRRG